MPLKRFTAENFRCLGAVELALDADYNVIHGKNASGKTSLLEAIAYLGRGKSFRGASTADLIRHGTDSFTLFGQLETGAGLRTLGVRNGGDGLEVKIDGDSSLGAAGLAAALPLQIIDPDVHKLVAAGPETRRRFLDWIAFHVEPGYLALWRRFRRALRQRNAALRAGAGDGVMQGWNIEFQGLSQRMDEGRSRALAAATASLQRYAATLLGVAVSFEYQRGWTADRTLQAVLEDGLARDRQQGGTQAGPHRADLRIVRETRKARGLVSRGQQKLLASAMVLAATETVQGTLGRPLLLLLDDPAAELDRAAVERLMTAVLAMGCQVVASGLDAAALDFGVPGAVFHVKHGELERVG